MRANVGSVDKIVRVALALVLGILILTQVVSGVIAIVFGILAMVLLLTSVIGFCPLYLPFGISTIKRRVGKEH